MFFHLLIIEFFKVIQVTINYEVLESAKQIYLFFALGQKKSLWMEAFETFQFS